MSNQQLELHGVRQISSSCSGSSTTFSLLIFFATSRQSLLRWKRRRETISRSSALQVRERSVEERNYEEWNCWVQQRALVCVPQKSNLISFTILSCCCRWSEEYNIYGQGERIGKKLKKITWSTIVFIVNSNGWGSVLKNEEWTAKKTLKNCWSFFISLSPLSTYYATR